MTPPTPDIELTLVSLEFENNSIIITLEWTVENGAFSSLSVVPQTEIVNLGPSSRQLVITYNTSCSVKVNLDTVSCLLNVIHGVIIVIVIDCGRPSVNMNASAIYNSTSFNARLILTVS